MFALRNLKEIDVSFETVIGNSYTISLRKEGSFDHGMIRLQKYRGWPRSTDQAHKSVPERHTRPFLRMT